MDNGKELSKRRKEIKKIAMKRLRDRPPIFNKQAGFYITITGGGIDEEETWIIVTEVKGRGISLYSISDSNRVLTGIEKPV